MSRFTDFIVSLFRGKPRRKPPSPPAPSPVPTVLVPPVLIFQASVVVDGKAVLIA